MTFPSITSSRFISPKKRNLKRAQTSPEILISTRMKASREGARRELWKHETRFGSERASGGYTKDMKLTIIRSHLSAEKRVPRPWYLSGREWLSSEMCFFSLHQIWQFHWISLSSISRGVAVFFSKTRWKLKGERGELCRELVVIYYRREAKDDGSWMIKSVIGGSLISFKTFFWAALRGSFCLLMNALLSCAFAYLCLSSARKRGKEKATLCFMLSSSIPAQEGLEE